MAKTELLYGLHSVKAIMETHPENVLELMIQQGRDDKRIAEILQLAESFGLAVQRVKAKTLEQLLRQADSNNNPNHQGVVARCREQALASDHELDVFLEKIDHPPFLLVLDSLTDPQNLGACLRVADGAGVDAVITTKDKAVGLTPVVRRVASGAAESVPFFQVTNLTRSLRYLQNRGVFVVGTALEEHSRSLYDVDLTGPLAIVMGAEGKGLRRLVKEAADQLVYLPMKGKVQSLNVATASGICLYEALRQRAVFSGS
ncbi:MAG: 23S rRNA (guanosine(2251)-2'-O)-methyltransferase RlmB [Pseudomonadales bacterium]|nr:23S rRNA (guanosine(2251)-2'-O)-methyltransferase RlmB [Pseudomonadales bacterium]